MMIVGIVIVSMTVSASVGSFAEPTVGTGVVMVCRIRSSVSKAYV